MYLNTWKNILFTSYNPKDYSLIFLFFCLLTVAIAKAVAVQLLSCVWLFATPWTAAHQVSLFFTISQSLLKLSDAEATQKYKEHNTIFTIFRM